MLGGDAVSDTVQFGKVNFYPDGHPNDRWVGKRVKRLCISKELLLDFLKNPVPPGISQEGIPQDARIVFAEWDHKDSICIEIYLESEAFTLVVPQSIVPALVPTYRVERDK